YAPLFVVFILELKYFNRTSPFGMIRFYDPTLTFHNLIQRVSIYKPMLTKPVVGTTIIICR
ncbi:MAG TPA: hypothetical protein PKI55_17020, partial [Chitinophagaceae bacterium]|nr:hypothetical protein [Chitinophagaceae bacterium]